MNTHVTDILVGDRAKLRQKMLNAYQLGEFDAANEYARQIQELTVKLHRRFAETARQLERDRREAGMR